MINNNTWHEVSKQSPCMICDRPDWCSRTTDGNVSLCRRVHTGKGIPKLDKNGEDDWLYFHDRADG